MSSLWKHFIRLTSGYAKCKYCGIQYNVKKTIASLRYHIKNKHAEKDQAATLINESDSKSGSEDETLLNANVNKRGRLTTDSQNPEPGSSTNNNDKRRKIPTRKYYARNNPKSEAITISLVKMIAMDMLPLSFAEGPGMEQFLRTVCSEYTKPSVTVIKNRLQGIYDVVRYKLTLTLNNLPHISITTDGWSSRANDSFVTITAHAIDDQWNLRSFTLDTLEMTESHTAKNTYNHLKTALSSWNLYEKVTAVVHDNAPYMVAAIRDYWSNDNEIDVSVRCTGHSLQCVVKRALKDEVLSECLRKISAVVGHFKHSNKASTALTAAQKKYRLPIHRLISHCPTRWNSAFAMIERVIEQHEAITCVLLDKEVTTPESMKKLLLSNDDWDYITDVKKILEPFDVATRIMSSESHSTIAMVRPTAHSISKKFLQVKDDDSEEIHLLKEILEEELRTRFLKTTTVNVCGLACYLDPRYKDLCDEAQSYRQKVKNTLLEIITGENTHHEFQTSTKDQREKDLEYIFDPELGLSGDLERTLSFEDKTAIEKEIEKYDKELTVPKGDNPLLWWSSKRHKYPTLATYARRYLGIPSSSTPSERVFSTAGNVISTKRSCLLPDNANLLIFLYQNREMIEETD